MIIPFTFLEDSRPYEKQYFIIFQVKKVVYVDPFGALAIKIQLLSTFFPHLFHVAISQDRI